MKPLAESTDGGRVPADGEPIGRDAEMADVEDFLRRVPNGPVGLVVSGEAGIGKTEIWIHGVRAAAERGYRVLEARPAERERALAFAALRDLLHASFPDVEASLPRPQRDALSAALLLRQSIEPVDPRTVATALGTAVAHLARTGPVLVAIDDAHWLDRASERAIAFALRRPPTRLGVLLTARAEGRSSPLGLEAALGRKSVSHLAVGPLPPEALRMVIRSAGFEPSHSAMTRLAAVSGGNPFYGLEIARAMDKADLPPGEPLPVTPALADLVRERVAGLSPSASMLATIVAAMFRPTQQAVEAALGREVDVGPAILEAEEADIIEWDGDRIRFTHPLIGSALYGALPVGRRRALHRQLADAALDPEDRAHHLVGGTVGQDEDAARDIEQAAGLANRRGAADSAAELYRVAERLTPRGDNVGRARRALGAANALTTAGDLPAARALARAARELAPSGSLRARALLLDGTLATYAGSIDEQAAALEAALVEAGHDTALRIEILLALSGSIDVDPVACARFAGEAVLLARETGDSAGLARALANVVMVSGVLGLGARRDLFEEAARLEAASVTSGVSSLLWCHWVDDVEGARERHRVQARLARDRGDAFAVAELAEFIAMVDFREGHWQAAERALEEACATLGQIGAAGPVIASFVDRSVIDAHRGRFDRARRTLREILDGDPQPDRFWAAVCLSGLGAVEFAAGDLRAADVAWTTMRETIGSIGWVDFLEDRSEPDHIEALVALGDRDRARKLLDHLEWRGRTLPRTWIAATLPRARAVLAAADGNVDGALAMIDATPPESLLPFENARLLLVKGQLERRANRRLVARRTLEAALSTFERLGSPPWVDRTRVEIGRLGLRHTGRHELTAMERRIAQLAATGLTNRQVANLAFVSPKTVEANLARVYGKLGIRSRAELGARIAGVGAASRPDQAPEM